MSRVLLASLCFWGCTASPTETPLSAEATPLEGEARAAAQAELRTLEQVMDFHQCIEDSDCTTTRFHDCCADAPGVAQCDWWAVRADQLPRREEACGIMECTFGASYCPETDEVPGPPRCAIYRIGDYVEGACELPNAAP